MGMSRRARSSNHALNPHERQRAAAKFKKVVVDADILDAEDFAPDSGEQFLHLGFGRNMDARGLLSGLRQPAGRAIDLAARGQRQFREERRSALASCGSGKLAFRCSRSAELAGAAPSGAK